MEPLYKSAKSREMPFPCETIPSTYLAIVPDSLFCSCTIGWLIQKARVNCWPGPSDTRRHFRSTSSPISTSMPGSA